MYQGNGSVGTQIIVRSDNTIIMEDFEIEKPGCGEVLIETVSTLISAGTELGTQEQERTDSFVPGYSNAVSHLLPRPERVGRPVDHQRPRQPHLRGVCDVVVIHRNSSNAQDPSTRSKMVVAHKREGDYFGETALIQKGQKRTAYVRAQTYTVLEKLTADALNNIVKKKTTLETTYK